VERVQQYVFGQLELFTVERLLVLRKIVVTPPREIHGLSVGPGFPRVAGAVQQYVFGRLELSPFQW
jgi:hypothetical protein